MIRVGCCGWPVSQERYSAQFSAIEISSTFIKPPLLATARRWRQTVPPDFTFSVRASRLVTHTKMSPTYEKKAAGISDKALGRCGHFKETEEVSQAWERTEQTARALKARFVVFQTPASFYPNADHLRDMYRFFKRLRREGMSLVWEPRGDAWETAMVRRVCGDLDLIHGVDPMIGEPARGAVRYFRLHGRHERGKIVYGHDYSDAELRHVLGRCEGRAAYVFFNNASMWRDAVRFEALTHPAVSSPRQDHVRHLRTF